MSWIHLYSSMEFVVFDPIPLAKAFACLFFAILFIQSGLDKVTDRKGNLDYLTEHFANSPLKGQVPMMLGTMTVVELVTGACNFGGIFGAFFEPMQILTVLGPALACVSFLMLFFGQRIAKDYAGAASLATYFVVALVALYLNK